MTEIFSWVRQMICLSVFLVVLLQLLPGGNYRKYVCFFAGLLFVVAVAAPLNRSWDLEQWKQNLLKEICQPVSEADLSEYEIRRQEQYDRQLADAVKHQVEQQAENLGFTCHSVKAVVAENGASLESIRVILKRDSTETDSMEYLKQRVQKFQQQVMQTYQLARDRVEVKVG